MMETPLMYRGGISPEYDAVAKAFEGKVAKRSGLHWMNHINEGLVLLHAMRAPEISKQVFCLHPLRQLGISALSFGEMKYLRVLEFHEKNGRYRNDDACTDIDHVQLSQRLGEMTNVVAYALLADKLQNQKDFLIYHSNTHPRRVQLDYYFNTWILALEGRIYSP